MLNKVRVSKVHTHKKFVEAKQTLTWHPAKQVKRLQLDTACPLGIVHSYFEFKLRYPKNQKLFSIRVKEYIEPIVLRKAFLEKLISE